ncbi:PLP-dependent transferase [Polyporus arcularius HHB13444]|uniref:PLP-dependent transferase n=1 Tax=Polyporus arcularius HHB13444 TaxID=1314778 RepID=A0A5C3NTN6_9APHY|nr:PLP-dependent transferase [Polyporus arcularius HHB13444]
MSSPLDRMIDKVLDARRGMSIGCPDLHQPMPTTAPDLFSNDCLSVTTSPRARDAFLKRVTHMLFVFGSGGSRLLTGNQDTHTDFFGGLGCIASTAALFNSGYDANLAFWSTIPQKGDAVVFDEFVHASTRDGMAASPLKSLGALYAFKHNSVPSFRERVQQVLEAYPNIANGQGMLFVAVETLYSMEGDYAPLLQLLDAVDELIPKGCAHVMVDEAHTSSLFGPDGRGLLWALGLQGRGWGMSGGNSGDLDLTSCLEVSRTVLYSRPLLYTTSLPHAHICGLNTVFDYLASPDSTALRNRLRKVCNYFEHILETAPRHVPPNLLSLLHREIPADYPSKVFSPIFPLIKFLRPLGYAVTAIPYPTVPRGKEQIRVVLHAGNTEEELDEFVTRLLQWVTMMEADEERRQDAREEDAHPPERAKL